MNEPTLTVLTCWCTKFQTCFHACISHTHVLHLQEVLPDTWLQNRFYVLRGREHLSRAIAIMFLSLIVTAVWALPSDDIWADLMLWLQYPLPPPPTHSRHPGGSVPLPTWLFVGTAFKQSEQSRAGMEEMTSEILGTESQAFPASRASLCSAFSELSLRPPHGQGD